MKKHLFTWSNRGKKYDCFFLHPQTFKTKRSKWTISKKTGNNNKFSERVRNESRSIHIIQSGDETRVSAKTPLAPYFLVLPLLFSSFWILYTCFEETMKHFTVNVHPSSIYERTLFLPRCALEARKGLSALIRLIKR